jgi:hypothetical protein
MTKLVVIVVAGIVAACAWHVCGDRLWEMLIAMHTGHHS